MKTCYRLNLRLKSIDDEINETKDNLNNLIYNDDNLTSKDTISLSQKLDKLISNYTALQIIYKRRFKK